MGSWEASYRDQDLPAEATRVELRGAPRSLAWPRLCPNCGAPAWDRVLVKKIFRRMRGGKYQGRGWIYVIRPLEIPLCADCARLHHEQLRPASSAEIWRAALLTPLMIPVVFGSYFALVALRVAVRATGQHDQWAIFGIAGLFALAAAYGAFAAWRSTRFQRVPPQTEVALACDWSDNMGFIVGERHVYAIRNPDFARALTEANRARVWTEADGRRERRRKLAFSIAVFVSLIAAGLLLHVF